MKFGISYAYWLHEWECNYINLIPKVKDLGFDVLEIGANHVFNMTKNELLNLRTTSEKHNLKLILNCGPKKDQDLSSPDKKIRKKGLDFFSVLFEKMKLIESNQLIGALYSYWPSDFTYVDKESAWNHSIECLKELGEKAKELDIFCSIEILNRNETYILNDSSEGIKYIDIIDNPNINLLLDTYHMNIEEDNMYNAIRDVGEKLGHLHVGECNRKLPGENNSINWKEIGFALKEIRYDKSVVIEPFILKGGSVGFDTRVWRDLSNNANESTLDTLAVRSLSFLKQQLDI